MGLQETHWLRLIVGEWLEYDGPLLPFARAGFWDSDRADVVFRDIAHAERGASEFEREGTRERGGARGRQERKRTGARE